MRRHPIEHFTLLIFFLFTSQHMKNIDNEYENWEKIKHLTTIIIIITVTANRLLLLCNSIIIWYFNGILFDGTRHETHFKLQLLFEVHMHSYEYDVVIKCALCLPFQCENTLLPPSPLKHIQIGTVDTKVRIKGSNWYSMNAEM